MRKSLYTLNIGRTYAPEITALTYPLLKAYAAKVGAEFVEITERRSPAFPVTYEKLQIFELACERRDDWSVFADADALISPDMMDITEHLPRDTVFHVGRDPASIRFRRDDYFRRDGRNFGSCNWFAIASSWCRDLWHPLDIPLEAALAQIFPTMGERTGSDVVDGAHLIDDYTLSRNIARFGLKATTMTELWRQLDMAPSGFWHIYTKTTAEKVIGMKEALVRWKVLSFEDIGFEHALEVYRRAQPPQQAEWKPELNALLKSAGLDQLT